MCDGTPAVVSIATAAAYLGISERMAYKMARNHTFPVPVLRIGRLVKVSKAALEGFVEGDPDA